jgi:RNA polymerase sigma-70 factor (ECF subfamily)
VNLGELHRREYGRILASLVRVLRDIGLAEDALQEAFAVAHVRWAETGPPINPVAWLMTTARNKAIDQIRRRTFAAERQADIAAAIGPEEHTPVPVDSLRLIFTCCHPALAREAQVALTLRTVGGLSTEEIARAFLVPASTLAQRLVRAQTKIRLAGIPYEVPADDELAERIGGALAVVYLIFNEGYSATAGPNVVRGELCAEAIRLGRQFVELLPAEAEPRGLLALMLLNDARRSTRMDDAGDIVLLEDQDRTRWDHEKIAEGLAWTNRALRGARGPYAVQAAIAALHATAKIYGQTDWVQIARWYGVLAEVHPSPIVELNRAAAVAMSEGFERGLALMAGIELPGYHRLPAARGDLLLRLGRRTEAAKAFREALGLVTNEAERRLLERRLAEAAV